jgi:hypothetical protein
LENVKKDHEKRIDQLKSSQTQDEYKAELITLNLDLVDAAIFLINNAIANKIDWNDIEEIVDDAREDNHPVALSIKELNLNKNHITLKLK